MSIVEQYEKLVGLKNQTIKSQQEENDGLRKLITAKQEVIDTQAEAINKLKELVCELKQPIERKRFLFW